MEVGLLLEHWAVYELDELMDLIKEEVERRNEVEEELERMKEAMKAEAAEKTETAA